MVEHIINKKNNKKLLL